MSIGSELDQGPLLAVALQLGAARSLDTLLPVVLKHFVSLVGAERAVFALYDAAGELEDAVVHALDWSPGRPLPISNRIVGEALEKGELRERMVQDVVDPDAAAEAPYESMRHHQLRFVMACPVRVEGRAAGVLYADSRAPVRSESLRRMELARALAGIVGVAVENVRLHEEQRMRSLLLGKLVHDLNSPLLVLKVDADILQCEVQEPALRGVVDDVVFATNKLEAYARSGLRLAGISRLDETPRQRLDLSTVLHHHARFFRPLANEQRLELVVAVGPDVPAPTTWPDRLGLVLDNLILNAVKYAAPGSSVTLSAQLRDDEGPIGGREHTRSAMGALFRRVVPVTPDPLGGFVELSVHNHGAPIAPALLPRVFDEWVKGDHSGRVGASVGLGLAIVDHSVRSLGGRVWVESDADAGTTFRFTLPLAELNRAVPARIV